MIWLGIALFFGLHIMPSLPGVRDRLIDTMGANPYKGAYALLSLAGIVLMVMGYGNMDYQELWPTPVWARHLALTVMPIVFVLWMAAEFKGHLRKKLKHPMLYGMALWAGVHLLNNGDLASLYLFGSFGLYSLFAIVSANRRGKVPTYTTPKALHDVLSVGVGAALFAAVLWGHEFLFGVALAF